MLSFILVDVIALINKLAEELLTAAMTDIGGGIDNVCSNTSPLSGKSCCKMTRARLLLQLGASHLGALTWSLNSFIDKGLR